MSGRTYDFPDTVKKQAIKRQDGLCAMCGVSLSTPWTHGRYRGEAHHLKPGCHGGRKTVDNCVYLCWAEHELVGHGMAPLGMDKQGGSSDTWVKLSRRDFGYWNGRRGR